MGPERGFTLIEVLVALAILATALSAAYRVTSIATDGALEFRERLLAGWVADNRLAEIALAGWPEPGERRGTVEQGGATFDWRERIAETPDAGSRRIEVEVRAPRDPERAVARVVGYAFRATP